MATFDTSQAVEDLKASGIDHEQAAAIATVVQAGQGELATKADLSKLELRLVPWVLGIAGASLALNKLIPPLF